MSDGKADRRGGSGGAGRVREGQHGRAEPRPAEDALAEAGCEEVHEDHASGAKAERPGLAEALGHVRRGDTLVVWKLDRLGRSMAHLIDTVRRLEAKGVGFRSLTEGVDTTTPGGTLVFHIFGALAQFERDLIRERTSAGLKAAEARGRKGGRRPVVTPDKLARAKVHLAAGLTVREAAARLKVGKTALYKALNGSARARPEANSSPVPVWRTQRSLSCSDPVVADVRPFVQGADPSDDLTCLAIAVGGAVMRELAEAPSFPGYPGSLVRASLSTASMAAGGLVAGSDTGWGSLGRITKIGEAWVIA